MSDKLTAAADLALTAFGVVLFSMAVLTLILLVIRRAARSIEARRRDDSPAPEIPVDEAIDARTVAILSAAISAALDKPVRIHRVHLHSAHDRERWGRAGRPAPRPGGGVVKKGDHDTLAAPLAGTVLKVFVHEGAVLEDKVYVSPTQTVQAGDSLIRLVPEG